MQEEKMQTQATSDNKHLDYSVISQNFINSIIQKAKGYLEDDFKFPLCYFLDEHFNISNAVILDYPPKVKFRFLSVLKKELKHRHAVAYIIIRRTTTEEKILRTEEENNAIPKTINNNYTLNNHTKYNLVIKDALALNFASKLEKTKIIIPYTKEFENITLENFREEPAKGGIIFNLLI